MDIVGSVSDKQGTRRTKAPKLVHQLFRPCQLTLEGSAPNLTNGVPSHDVKNIENYKNGHWRSENNDKHILLPLKWKLLAWGIWKSQLEQDPVWLFLRYACLNIFVFRSRPEKGPKWHDFDEIIKVSYLITLIG